MRKLIVDEILAVGFDRGTKTASMRLRLRGQAEPVEIEISAREFGKFAAGFRDLLQEMQAPQLGEKPH